MRDQSLEPFSPEANPSRTRSSQFALIMVNNMSFIINT